MIFKFADVDAHHSRQRHELVRVGFFDLVDITQGHSGFASFQIFVCRVAAGDERHKAQG